jgi:hypothetical protein
MPIIVVYSILNWRKSFQKNNQRQSPCINFVQQDFELIDYFSDVFAKVDKLLDRAYFYKNVHKCVFFSLFKWLILSIFGVNKKQ